MDRALSISERVSKMMTGHVAFGKPTTLCHLGLGPPCVPSPTHKNTHKNKSHSQAATGLPIPKLVKEKVI